MSKSGQHVNTVVHHYTNQLSAYRLQIPLTIILIGTLICAN